MNYGKRKMGRRIDGPAPPMPDPVCSPAQEKKEMLRLAQLCEEGWRAGKNSEPGPMRSAASIQKPKPWGWKRKAG